MRLFPKKKGFWTWLAVALLIILLHVSGALRPLEDYFNQAALPLARVFYNFPLLHSDAGSAGMSAKELSSQLEKTRKELASVTVDKAKLIMLQEENKKLRDQLDFLDKNNYHYMAAAVVARQNLFDNSAATQDVVIDKGSKDGISPGLGVVDEGGIIIGKIAEVKDHSARVCLTTGPNCQLPAAILNTAKTIGLTEGELGLTIKMDYIPQMESIAPGDIVVTSGLGGEIPRGLVIGRVSKVSKQSNEIWQDVSIEPLADRQNLTLVSVILP